MNEDYYFGKYSRLVDDISDCLYGVRDALVTRDSSAAEDFLNALKRQIAMVTEDVNLAVEQAYSEARRQLS